MKKSKVSQKAKYALKTQCEECGERLGEFFFLPLGFRVICQKCYEDFKHRRPPEQMHYLQTVPTKNREENKP